MNPYIIFLPPPGFDLGNLAEWAQFAAIAIGLYYAWRSAQSAQLSANLARQAVEQSSQQSRRTALFEHLRVIDERLNAVFGVANLAYVLSREASPTAGSTFSSEFRTYMSLFNALDLLAFAVARGEVDFEAVAIYLSDVRHLGGWLNDMTQRMQVLQAGNSHAWEHAHRLIERLDAAASSSHLNP